MVHPSFTDRDNPNWDESLELYMCAREAHDRENFSEAIKLFHESIRLSPHYKSLLLLGECLVREKRVNEAIVAFAAATTLNRSGIAPTHLAEIWFELGELDRAKEMIDLALQRQSHYKRAQELKKKIEAAPIE